MGFPPNPPYEHYERSIYLFQRLLESAGTGTHHVAMLLVGDAGVADNTIRFTQDEEHVAISPAEAVNACYMLAVALSSEYVGGMVMRSYHRDGKESVCGWRFEDGEARPMNRAEAFDAYCSDPFTGEITGPEPGLEYRDAPVIHL
ncbi:hypothetical protein ACFWMT_20275 [Streptomyces sp. NPDC058368]|uniref:hypothetical protein n=1 Tax=Streptomyces sp. NPDC058368 TaxID=3346461 RepID=UPI00364D6EF2